MSKPINGFLKSESLIVLLVAVALVLGVSIYFKNKQDVRTVSEPNTQMPTGGAGVDNNLTAEEKVLFYNPGPDAPKADFDKFFSQVNQSAVDGNKIVINDCKASPLVLRIKHGDSLTIDNQGTTDIHFGFQDERTLVKAGTNEKIAAKYKNGHGIYGYGCDNTSVARSIGVLLITP